MPWQMSAASPGTKGFQRAAVQARDLASSVAACLHQQRAARAVSLQGARKG